MPDTQSKNASAGAKRILIVEDERPLSHALKMKLSHEGYEVDVAEDGEEGVQKATHDSYDLILVDIIMPKMDGFQMLSLLKEAGIKAAIVVLSNLGQKEDIEKAKGLGAVDYMVKSNTPISRIVEMVNVLLKP